MNENNFDKLIGKWIHADPCDNDDYLAIYEVGGSEDKPIIKGKDTLDGEEFVITNVSWDGEVLQFESFMPSTKRKGINKFRLLDNGSIESEFSFTVVEVMKRVTTDENIV